MLEFVLLCEACIEYLSFIIDIIVFKNNVLIFSNIHWTFIYVAKSL